MKPAIRNAVLVSIGLSALVAGHFLSQRFYPRLDEDSAVPVDFSLPDLTAKDRWLSEWRGRVIVLNFWATWCGPCREEIPLLIKLQNDYQDHGVQVVGIAIDTAAAVTDYAKEMHINYPLLVDDGTGISLMVGYGNPRGFLPYTVIINRDGTIVTRKLGAYAAQELQTLLNALVKSDSPAILSK